MSITKIGALVHADPDAAKRLILEALDEARGDRNVAAAKLNTTLRTLYRLIERLDLGRDIDAQLEARGIEIVAGPPRAAKRYRDLMIAADGDLDRAARSTGTKREKLEARITELGLWDDINRALRALKLPPVSRMRKRSTAAA